MNNIFINATSCTVGGSKSILKQLLEEISVSNNREITYYVFVSNKELDFYNKKNLKIIDVNSKKWIKRILWDYYGLKKWSKKNGVFSKLVISLQNTGVKYSNEAKQIVYLHTPIPFVDYRWNIFKKNERILWFYKNIYPIIIKRSLNSNSIIVVQSNWLKKIVSDKMKVPLKNIKVFVPNISSNIINRSLIEKNVPLKNDKFTFFYPAFEYKYKNHEIIIHALNMLKNTRPDIYKKVKIVFTLDNSSWIKKKAKLVNVQEKIDFVGALSKKNVEEYYEKSSAILFPSYIETFGLPLLEAKSYGKRIITTNEEFSYEILGNYKNVDFIDKFSESEWSNKIIEVVDEYDEFEEQENKDIDLKDVQGWRAFVDYIETLK